MKRVLVKVGSLTGEDLREKSYSDQDESWFRGLLMIISFILMALIAIGLLIYRFSHPGVVSQTDFLGFETGSTSYPPNEAARKKAADLFTQLASNSSDRLKSLNCPCTKSAKVSDVNLGLTAGDLASFKSGCSSSISNAIGSLGTSSQAQPFVNYCDRLDFRISTRWSKLSVGSGELLNEDGFVEDLLSSYLDSCYTAADADYTIFRMNFLLYFQSMGIDSSEVGTVTTVSDQAYNGLFTWAAENCHFDNWQDSMQSFKTQQSYYVSYFEACAPQSCTYLKNESKLDSFLWCLGIFGTVWSFIMLGAGIVYGRYLKFQSTKVDNVHI